MPSGTAGAVRPGERTLRVREPLAPFRLAAEEFLFPKSHLGFEFLHLPFECLFALARPLVHAPIETRLSAQLGPLRLQGTRRTQLPRARLRRGANPARESRPRQFIRTKGLSRIHAPLIPYRGPCVQRNFSPIPHLLLTSPPTTNPLDEYLAHPTKAILDS